ncbi:MAG: AraC family transcriptional regulator [Eubacteriales bacterium]|nr:AraC family transcriptional regulator [Eubacteriales bacterium]
MDYREHIIKAIEYIEENLCGELSLSSIAREAGYSEYHFVRVFRKATGLTPANYIRKRRITEIVKCMDGTERSCSDIAFEYGFNSKENFVRAFKSEHNILPTEYRSAKNSLKLYEAIAFDQQPLDITPDIINLEAFILIVYKSDEAYPPDFWNKYNGRMWSKWLSGGQVCEDYGVSTWNAAENKLDYFIGIKEENACGDTTDTLKLKIKGGLYAVFSTPKTSPYNFINTIHRTWAYILNVWMPQSIYRCAVGNAYQFESYVEESRAFSEKIYIPIEVKQR